jgi:hypothetical protein
MGYRERRLAKAERLREWSEKRARRSAAAFESARKVADSIPLGQPILVGHHSEKRHRRDVARIDNGMRKGVEHERKAHDMSYRAASIEHAADISIYSDDVDAIERLREKLADLEAQRERMTAANAAYRKAHRAELKAQPSAYERSLMVPHPAYSLQNLGGNITRTRQRLAQLSGQPKRAEAAKVEGATATARAGLIVVASMTTPSRPGKQPRPVWNVTGALAEWRQFLIRIGGSWYRGAFSFWENPSEEIERACSEAETPVGEVAREFERVEEAAAPLAEVPFTLTAVIGKAAGKQEGLF